MVESVTAGRSLAALEVLEAFSDTIVVLDGAWRFTYLNRAALQVAGLRAEDLLGRTLWAAYPQLLGTPIEEAYRRAAADGKPQHVEAPGVISGRWYDIHAYPSRAGLVIYGRDVTGRVEAEQALRESERRHRALAEASPVGLFQTDGVGRCVYVNERWCRITGLTPAEAAGDGWERALHPDDRDRVFAEWRAATAGGPGSFSSEYRFRRPDGAVTWVFGQGAVERDAAGAPVRFAGTVTDITDRKHAELALAAMNEELERRVADRTASLLTRTRELEAAEALLRDAADHNARLTRELEHRVGNHLAGLLGLVAAMRQRGSEPGELARVMEGRLLAMAHVNRMLAADGWRPRSWRSLVQPLMEALGGAAAFRSPTRVNGPDAVIDPKQATAVALILAEWFTNSCKYGAHSVSGGRVDIDVEELADGPGGGGGSVRWLRLTWRERGGPPVEGPVTPSLGTEIVGGLARRELRGRCELSFPPAGAEHALEFPIAGEPWGRPEPLDRAGGSV